ncbi:MAG: DNA mismatch repair endonuclease MutL [Oscillospiraceae bacterium]
MGKINKLPKNIAELIAAGEVVERPASVVKELLENSIDACAKTITLEIESGGIKYIRITDDGCGIAREDVPLAFLSHATSKIKIADDLDYIMTLGFRGEALASVAAVSKTEIMTKTSEELNGTRMEIEGGEEILIADAGCPNGTTIIIRDLFYNTPARMKFLKTDRAEGTAVAAVVDKIALSHPEISIRFIKDGKQQLCTSGNGELISAIYSVYGKDLKETLIPVDYTLNGIKINGYISKPLCSRGSNSMQLFFVNNRYIKSKTASAALIEGYKNSIMVGKYPAAVLFMEMGADTVDVNVHPAKTEVRFSNDKIIFDAVYYSIKNALNKDVSRPQAKLNKINPTELLRPVTEKSEQIRITEIEQIQNTHTQPIFTDVPSKKVQTVNYNRLNSTENSSYKNEDELDLSIRTSDSANSHNNENKNSESSEPKEKSFKYLGEAFKAYIFAQYDGKLVIIDKHAAHERILFNKLKAEQKEQLAQLYLVPINVTLTKEEYNAIIQSLDLLETAGFLIDDFGSGSVIVRGCPLILAKEDITSLITEIAGHLTKNQREINIEKLDWIFHSVACRAAIKAGNDTSDYELIEFTKKLLSDDTIRYCPHGRPVLIEMTKYELDKQFGRV